MTKIPETKILRPGTPVSAGGETIMVKPLTLNQIIDSTDLLSALSEDAQTMNWMQILKKRRDEIYSILAVTTGTTAEFIGNLPGDEAWALIEAFLAENQSFFVDQLIPFVVGVLQQQTAGSVGETLSASSETSDTTGLPAAS